MDLHLYKKRLLSAQLPGQVKECLAAALRWSRPLRPWLLLVKGA
ncbi:hypothetical protein HaLaN_12602 [Haematococcus lacustris]|uniref:Uncharacterized protein n=1 Tax=Haematococcus lacustris TaxID=44745 RepID=A0A699Z2F4_HAELA|nr:hypothetical protein HaLaN_12602 [Haematococcus lacustris]